MLFNDLELRKHSVRVGLLCSEIAKLIGLHTTDINLYYMIGRLHDIGKLRVPNRILNKPGRLTDFEFLIIKDHVLHSEDILKQLGYSEVFTEAVRHHHENYDGTGYPDNLVGEKIPLASRIIRIADTYDALREVRSYREPKSLRETLEIMHEMNDAGCFDMKLFELFESNLDLIIKNQKLEYAKAIAYEESIELSDEVMYDIKGA